MLAPQEIVDLVDRFQRNRESYDDARFNEMQTRIQFLNPIVAASLRRSLELCRAEVRMG